MVIKDAPMATLEDSKPRAGSAPVDTPPDPHQNQTGHSRTASEGGFQPLLSFKALGGENMLELRCAQDTTLMADTTPMADTAPESIVAKEEPEDDSRMTTSSHCPMDFINDVPLPSGTLLGDDDDSSEQDPVEKQDELNARLAVLTLHIGKLQRIKGKKGLSAAEMATLREMLQTKDQIQQQLSLFDRPRQLRVGKTQDEETNGSFCLHPGDHQRADEHGRQEMAGDSLQHGSEPGAAISSASTKKRSSALGASIKNKTVKAVSRQRRGPKKQMDLTHSGPDKKTEVLRDLLVAQQPLRVRAGMGELPPERRFQAKTVKEQAKKHRQETKRYTEAEKKKFREDERALKQARHVLASKGTVTVANEKLHLKGMKTDLYNYQLIGASWMVIKERTHSLPHGGILADAMGFGKTVEALAVVIAHPPSDADRKCHRTATLVVAPSGLLPQWGDEVEKHCEDISCVPYQRQMNHGTFSTTTLRKTDVMLAPQYTAAHPRSIADTQTRLISYKELSIVHAQKQQV